MHRMMAVKSFDNWNIKETTYSSFDFSKNKKKIPSTVNWKEQDNYRNS